MVIRSYPPPASVTVVRRPAGRPWITPAQPVVVRALASQAGLPLSQLRLPYAGRGSLVNGSPATRQFNANP
jgi:hypothetical protein